MSRAGQRTVISLPDGTAQENGLGAAVSASARNADGVELTNETRVGYYRVELDGLPAGGAQYELTLTGTGYQPFRHTVTLDSYSQHVIVGTGDGTFSLGDVTGDGVVDASDLTALDAQLGKTAGAAQLGTYDLNGDGKLDVTDLAYINHTRGASKEVQVLDTAAIVPALLDERTLTLSGGTSDDLFLGGKDITIAPAQGSALELPIQFNVTAGVEMSQINIICPDAPGAILSGKAEVTLANGAVLDVPFNTSSPAGAYAIGPVEGQRLVTIDLGKKVPVKRVTIKVTATVGQPGYATVTKIEFLKDIVPDDPKSGADQVSGEPQDLLFPDHRGQRGLARHSLRSDLRHAPALRRARGPLQHQRDLLRSGPAAELGQDQGRGLLSGVLPSGRHDRVPALRRRPDRDHHHHHRADQRHAL